MFCLVVHFSTVHVTVNYKRPIFWTTYSGMRERWNRYPKPGFQFPCYTIFYCAPTYFIVILLVIGGSLPAIICVEVAMSKYKDTKGIGYYAARGLGYHLCVPSKGFRYRADGQASRGVGDKPGGTTVGCGRRLLDHPAEWKEAFQRRFLGQAGPEPRLKRFMIDIALSRYIMHRMKIS